MNSRISAIFVAILAISCSDAESPPLAGAGAVTGNAATQNQPQPALANAGGTSQAEVSPANTATPSAANSGSSAAGTKAAPAAAGSTAPAAANDAGELTAPASNSSTADAASADSDAGPAQDKSLCPDGFPRGTASHEARKLLALKPSPEGVTMCPNGQVFLSLDDGQIIRVDPENPAPEPWTTLTGIEPAGITCDEHNELFVAIYAVRSGSTKPGVLHISEQAAPGSMLPAPDEASPLAAYNGILAIAGQGVYATDSGAGWVVRTRQVKPGEYVSEIVARDIPIANGLAYDTAHHKLYVASSLDFAVYTFDLTADGALQNRSKVKTSSSSFFDGTAVDENGEIYAADYSGNSLVRLSDAKVIATLPTPASLAFRGGTLLMTDYRLNQPDAEGGLYAIDLGACSAQQLR